jgi:hypothetical protein
MFKIYIYFLPEWYNGKSVWAKSTHGCGGGLSVGLIFLGVLWLRAEGSVVLHSWRMVLLVVVSAGRVVFLAHALVR